MCIRCLTRSTWKVQIAKLEALARRRHAVLRLSIHESASEVNHLGGDAQVVSCHHYLVVFHPFVEQLTVFHRPRFHAIARWHPERHMPKGT